jgi:hypothetical protein
MTGGKESTAIYCAAIFVGFSVIEGSDPRLSANICQPHPPERALATLMSAALHLAYDGDGPMKQRAVTFGEFHSTQLRRSRISQWTRLISAGSV